MDKEVIEKLHKETGCGYQTCKKAYLLNNMDYDKALFDLKHHQLKIIDIKIV